MESKKITYRTSLLTSEKEVIITPDLLCLKHKNAKFKTLHRHDFDALRFGIKWVYFLIPVGLKFSIKLKSFNDTVLTINMYSILGIQYKKNYEIFKILYEQIRDKLLSSKCQNLIDEIEKNGEIKVGKYMLTKHQLSILKNRKVVSSYFLSEIEILEFKTSCTVVSKSDRKTIIDLNFYSDWNAATLFSLIKELQFRKQLNTQ